MLTEADLPLSVYSKLLLQVPVVSSRYILEPLHRDQSTVPVDTSQAHLIQLTQAQVCVSHQGGTWNMSGQCA